MSTVYIIFGDSIKNIKEHLFIIKFRFDKSQIFSHVTLEANSRPCPWASGRRGQRQ
jgi:hypothetical protein